MNYENQIKELQDQIYELSEQVCDKKDKRCALWRKCRDLGRQPVKLVFADMLGNAADCQVKPTENGSYELFLNGVCVPCVLDHHLEYGVGFQKVIIEVAVKSYESSYHALDVEFPEKS